MASRQLTQYEEDAPLNQQPSSASASVSMSMPVALTASISTDKAVKYGTMLPGCEWEAAELDFRRRRYANWHPGSTAKKLMMFAGFMHWIFIGGFIGYGVINGLEAGNINIGPVISYPGTDIGIAGFFTVAAMISYYIARENWKVESVALAEKKPYKLPYMPLYYHVSDLVWLMALWTGMGVTSWIFWHNYDNTYPLQQQKNAIILHMTRIGLCWETLQTAKHRMARYLRMRMFAAKDS